jgi:hypothetical protein
VKSPYVLALTCLLLAFDPGRVSGQTDHSHDHHTEMNSRGDHEMGFSHEKTTYHFRLYTDVGSIDVEVNDPQDTATRDQIQMHLSHIARMFADGNFRVPMLISRSGPTRRSHVAAAQSSDILSIRKNRLGRSVRIAATNPR